MNYARGEVEAQAQAKEAERSGVPRSGQKRYKAAVGSRQEEADSGGVRCL